MKQSKDKKKQKLTNIGTATALTITLVTTNMPTPAYAGEFETNEDVVIENVVTEEVLEEVSATEEVEDVKESTEETTKEEFVAAEKAEVTKEVVEKVSTEEIVAEKAYTQKVERQAVSEYDLDLNDWDYAVYSSAIILNKYKGNNTNVIVPGKTFVSQQFIPSGSTFKEGAKTVKMGTLDSTKSNDCFAGKRDTITNLEFKEVDGKKVEFSVDSGTGKMYKGAFSNLTAMKTIDLSGADVAVLPTDMSEIFKGCSSLEQANLKGINLEAVTNMSKMFSGCTSLTTVDLSGINLRSLTNMNGMFNGCTSLKKVDLSGANLSGLKTINNNVFTGIATLEEVNLSGADLSGLENITNVFKDCTSIRSIDLSNIKTSTKLTNVSHMFSGLANLETVNIDGLELQNATNIWNMFNGCSSLREVDLRGFDTSKVTNITNLFLGCSSLETVKLGGEFNTSQVTKFNNMFKDCTNLRRIDTHLLDTRSADNMSYMFSDSGVETLDLTNFNTEQVTDMTGMFRNTRNLKDIKFGDKFKTNNVTKMPFMFCNSNVDSLDLSNFETSQVLDMTAMFGSLDNITKLNLSNFVLNLNVNMHRMFARHISVPSANATITENQDENLKKVLLVIGTDEKLKAHNYEEDYCLPVGLEFNSVGGQFTNGEEVLELKTNVVERILGNAEIDTLLEEVVKNVKIPTKDGHEFVAWREVEPKVTNSTIKTYYAEWAGTPVADPEDHPVQPDTDFDDEMEVNPDTDQVVDNTPVILPDDVIIEPDTSIDPDGFKPVEDGTHMDDNMVTPGSDEVLPQTGGKSSLILLGTAALMSIAGLVLMKGKKKDK